MGESQVENEHMIIYMAKNIVNGKAYIGQTIRSLSDRMSKHFYDAFQRTEDYYFYRALRKYGKESFVWGVICECKTQKELDSAEIKYISHFKTNERNHGYNIKIGGNGGSHSDETKEKIRIANTGYKHSKSAKKKMSVSKSGKNNPNYGKPMEKSRREKISKSHVGLKHTPETIEKIRQAKTGTIITKETRIKISEAKTGKTFSDEAKQNMRRAQIELNGKPVLMLDKDTEDVVMRFECTVDASSFFEKGSRQNIIRALRGKRKTAYGYKWKYDNKTQIRKEV